MRRRTPYVHAGVPFQVQGVRGLPPRTSQRTGRQAGGCGREAPLAPPEQRPADGLRAWVPGEAGARELGFFRELRRRNDRCLSRCEYERVMTFFYGPVWRDSLFNLTCNPQNSEWKCVSDILNSIKESQKEEKKSVN